MLQSDTLRHLIIAQGASPEAAAAKAIGLITEHLQRLLAEKGDGTPLHAALCGGSSPYSVLNAMLSTDASRKLCEQMHYWPLDERVVAPNSVDFNLNELHRRFLSRLPDPSVHWPTFQSESISEADMAASLAALNEDRTRHLKHFDLGLVGVGPDGHIASLFPEHVGARDQGTAGFIEITESPKPPPRRITVTPREVQQTSLLLLMVFGQGKSEALQMLANYHKPAIECPARFAWHRSPEISAENATVILITDLEVPAALKGYEGRLTVLE